MTTSIFLNNNNEAATIKVNVGYNEDNSVMTESRTWEQLTDSNKQAIASEWIKNNVHCNVNQVMELLSNNYDHCDFDEYMSIAVYQDFEGLSTSHINDLSIDELIEIAADLDLDIDEQYVVLKDKLLSDLLEKCDLLTCNIESVYEELETTLSRQTSKKLNEYKSIDDIIEELKEFLKEESYSYDDIDTLCINLNINFDGYLKAFQVELATLVIDDIDLDQYGRDNDLEPDYEQAYEFWSVSDHFISMLQDSEQCSNDILGLSVWARYCTGQSICLDAAIQKAAFKVLSDTAISNY